MKASAAGPVPVLRVEQRAHRSGLAHHRRGGRPVAGAGLFGLAIETALGGRLQDVIVERWQDAERHRLAQALAGRAGHLPAAGDSAPQPAGQDAPGPGVVGLASDLVGSGTAPGDRSSNTWGRAVVTRDLPTTRRVDSYRERPDCRDAGGDIIAAWRQRQRGSQSAWRDQACWHEAPCAVCPNRSRPRRQAGRRGKKPGMVCASALQEQRQSTGRSRW